MSNEGIIIIQEQNVIEAISQFPIFPQYRNFSITAISNDQTTFTLSDYPVLTGIVSVNVNGIAQDPLNGDYTISNNILTLAPGIEAGDRVSGFYQVMFPAVSSNALNFSSYFEEVGTPSKSVFTLDFQPAPVIYVAVNGILQNDNDYSISGYTLTLNTALDIGDKLYIVGINS